MICQIKCMLEIMLDTAQDFTYFVFLLFTFTKQLAAGNKIKKP